MISHGRKEKHNDNLSRLAGLMCSNQPVGGMDVTGVPVGGMDVTGVPVGGMDVTGVPVRCNHPFRFCMLSLFPPLFIF